MRNADTASDLTTCFRQYRFGQFRPVSSADLVNGGHSESIGRLRRQRSRESVRRGRLVDLFRVVSVDAGAGQAVPDDVADDRVSAVVDGRRPLQTDRGSVHLGGKRTARLTGRTSCTYAPDRRPTRTRRQNSSLVKESKVTRIYQFADRSRHTATGIHLPYGITQITSPAT